MDDTALLKKLTESNDLESYVRHFGLLSKLQKRQRKETLIGDETKIDERPHHFALKKRLLISIVYFWRTIERAMMRPSTFSDSITM